MKLFAVYDRDYYCQEEIESILCGLRSELTAAHIHGRKEMENYLLVIPVLQRVLEKRAHSRSRRAGEAIVLEKGVVDYLEEITAGLKIDAQSQYIGRRLGYYQGRKEDTSTISRAAIETFENMWKDMNSRMQVTPGKTTLRLLRDAIQTDYNVNMTDVQIIDEFKEDEVPDDLRELIINLDAFRKS
ncbi:hypothetical protein [Pseudomonas chlororaphis]|uniref:hypothetical protein n=1 Tax=Pseudomonas chlororaphis TaxID=587753 RepID=UPI000F6B7475|nr:hypothetical protein [Pseudomonas chlororaphis]AZE25782.1 hypothetical protein C4K08_5381 [Pseudomonas chlororaphis subsp. aureofaciens]